MNIEKLHLLVNPVSGSNKGQENFDKVTNYLDQNKINYSVEISEFPGEIVNLARIASNEIVNNDHEIILVIGGDGTLNQAVNGVKSSKNPKVNIGFIPSGTGNDFAKALKINKNPTEQLEQILNHGEVLKVDLGFVDDQNRHQKIYFVNNLGIGFDALVVSLTNKSKLKTMLNKLHMGSLAYVLHVIVALFRQGSYDITVAGNNKTVTYHNVFLTTTTNHPYFGGGVNILPTASPTDKKIATVVIERPNFFKFFYLFFKLFKDGSHLKSDYVHVIDGNKITIESKSLQFGQIDGEELGSRSFDLEFFESSFNLIK